MVGLTDNVTRMKLVRTATNLFYDKGYSETSIRDIGKKTNISSSIIYHYFKNKEEILFEIIFKAEQDLIKMLEEIEDKHSDPLECIEEMLFEHAVKFGHKKAAKIVVSAHHGLSKKHSEASREAQRKIYEIYKNKLKQISNVDLLKELDETVISFSIFGIINWFFNWHKNNGKLSKEEVAQIIIKLLFHGIIK